MPFEICGPKNPGMERMPKLLFDECDFKMWDILDFMQFIELRGSRIEVEEVKAV